MGRQFKRGYTCPRKGGLPATTYGYRLRAYNAIGYSVYSTTEYLTPSSTPPAAPVSLTLTSATDGTSVLVAWWDDAGNETTYKVQRCTGLGCAPTDLVSLPANTLYQNDSPTTPSTVYGYAVCAVNGGGVACTSPAYVTTNGPSSNVHYYIEDHLGSTTLVVNASGTVEQEEMFYPYGGERWSSGADANRYKFTGKERDSETGLDYFGARYYGSSMARWMSPDWATLAFAVPYAEFADPQSLNLYAHVRNNPLRRVDPDGHDDRTKIEEVAYQSDDAHLMVLYQKKTVTTDIKDSSGNVIGQQTTVTNTYAEYSTAGSTPKFIGGSQTLESTITDAKGNVTPGLSSGTQFSRNEEAAAMSTFRGGISTAYEVFAGNTRLLGNVKYVANLASGWVAGMAIAGEMTAAKVALQAKQYGTALKDIGKVGVEVGKEYLVEKLLKGKEREKEK